MVIATPFFPTLFPSSAGNPQAVSNDAAAAVTWSKLLKAINPFVWAAGAGKYKEGADDIIRNTGQV